MRELLGRLLATMEAQAREICSIRKESKEHREWVRVEFANLSTKVIEHRVGWRFVLGLGGISLAALIAAVGLLR